MIGYIVTAIVITALVDRYVLERKDITHLSLGHAEVQSKFVRIPLGYRSTRANLRGATVSYSFRDARKPTTVIDGPAARISGAVNGENSDWLYIPKDYMPVGRGKWILTVTVKHGDSFLNPLYRIHPVSLECERVYNLVIKED